MTDGRFTGRVALVTGGGSGIGAATARRLAAEGARVVVTGRRAEPLEVVAEQVGGVAIAGDARDPAHVEAAIGLAVEQLGGLDVLVANAGIAETAAVGDLTDESWQRTLDINLSAPMAFARAALPSMLARRRGAIVMVASVNGLVNAPNAAAYDTSKAALLGLTRSLALDYGAAGIRTNAVCPGWVVTPMGDDDMDVVARNHQISREEAYALATAHVPMRRPAAADEIAACCAFLASDDASYVNGAALVVDGGGLAVDVASIPFGTTSAPDR